MPKEYNFIYNKLVSDQNDIVGHVAYSIYKQEKIKFIKEKSESGESVSDENLKSYHEFSSSESSIESYKIKAEIILQAFLENTVGEMTDDLENEVKNNHEQFLEVVAKRMKAPWWHGVLIGVASSFIFALLIALIGFIIQFNGSLIEVSITPSQISEHPKE